MRVLLKNFAKYDPSLGSNSEAVNHFCGFNRRCERRNTANLINVLLVNNFLHPADLSVRQANLDPVRMGRRICQQVFDDADGLFAGPLVLFEDDCDLQARVDVFSLSVRHY